MTGPPIPDPREDRLMIIRTFEIFCDGVTEVRLLEVRDGSFVQTVAGFFDDEIKLGENVLRFGVKAKGCYFTINKLNPALLARANNRMEQRVQQGFATKDHEITRRLWLPIDLDPIRPTGIPSSDEEHALAHERAKKLRDHLAGQGWPNPVYADSGNGAHLAYRIDLPPDDGGTVERCLRALAAKFDDDQVKVDQTVFNPARIWKLYGTVARKGDSIPGRVRRLSKLLDVPDKIQVVTL